MTKLTLAQLYVQHVGMVSDKWSIYLYEYERIFTDYRDRPLSLLEIGIQNGGSLEIWAKYFKNAKKFVGCDINPNCAELRYNDPRIAVVIGDASASSTQAKILELSSTFDIIIDDGSHRSSDIVKAFARYFPFLADGGVYVAEDLHCSYWQEFEGGLFAPFSSLTFFKRLADIVNHEHWGIEKTAADLLSGFFSKYGFQIDTQTLQHVHSVEFINSMCAVRKAKPDDNRLGTRIVAGSVDKVDLGIVRLNGLSMSSTHPPLSEVQNEWSVRSMPPEEELALFADETRERKQQGLVTMASAAQMEQTEQINQSQAVERDTLKAQLAEKEQRLLSANLQLNEILTSRAWRFAAFLRNIRIKLVPRESFKERILKVAKGIILNPKSAIPAYSASLVAMIARLPKGIMAVSAQDRRIGKMYSKDARKLILFLVPGYDIVNGGVMSIVSLVKVSAELESEHGAEVIACTLPGHLPLTRYSKFENSVSLFRFDQIPSFFGNLDELIVHIPEAYVAGFPSVLRTEQREFLRNIPNLQINILIQNIWLMPSRDVVDALRELTTTITGTTAHTKYCTQDLREKYNIPLHHFSVSFLTDYYYKPYEEKENLLIVSHDASIYKEAILNRIRAENEGVKPCLISNITYENYKRLISRAKWVITFGEGLDGYFIEGIRSGAIPFAVYNADFFSDHFVDLPNIYSSYDEMLQRLPSDLRKLDNPTDFGRLSKLLMQKDNLEYNETKYRENVRNFYLKRYTLP